MGAAVSNQVAKQIIASSQSIANQYIQGCTGTGNQTFGVDISKGCVANIGTIDVTNNQIVSITCAQNNTTTSSMKADIQAQINQQALAAAQSIGWPSASIASSIAQTSEGIAQTITSIYTQTCLGAANQTNNIKCTDPGSKLTIGVIDVNNTQAIYANCIQENITTSGVTDQMAQIIGQQTDAQESDTLATVVILFLVIGGIFLLFFVNMGGGTIGWILILIFVLIIVALIVYAIFAFSRKLYPFNKGSSLS